MAGEADRGSDPPADTAATADSVAQSGPGGVDDSAAELAEVKDRLLRVLADQEDFRRRIEHEREDAVRFAAVELIKDLLQTADNLARALESAPPDRAGQDQATQNLLAGVAASERVLQNTFARHGITRIEPALGEPFDPNRHQAMFEVEAGDWGGGTVAQLILPGYAYRERLLRPAFVAVAKGEAEERPEQGG